MMDVVSALAFSPDSRLLAAGDDSVIVLDVTDPADPARTATLTGHSHTVNGLAFSPDGHLLASCSTDKTVRLWKIA
jgi:WD40 repeat protein